MTTKRGEYTFDVGKAEEKRAEVSGYFHASASVEWRKTRYGDEPKQLIQMLVASLLPGVSQESYEVTDMRFTRYEPGANMIGWSALVSGSEEVLSRLKSKVGTRIEGDFSFEEARLLEVRSEREYP
jgi:hypothetical protein